MARLELRHQLLVDALQHARLCHLDDRLLRDTAFDHGLVRVRKDLEVDNPVEVAHAYALDGGAGGLEFLYMGAGVQGRRVDRRDGLTFSVDSSILLRRLSVRYTYFFGFSIWSAILR